MKAAERLVAELRRALALAGFDLVQPLEVGWYNAIVEDPLRLEDFGSGNHLAVVVGNTRALWPVWRRVLQDDASLASRPDPLDTYTERCLRAVTAGLGSRASVRFAHDAGERRVAMQRLAHVAGLAYLTESHLSVHPVYGPWIALRAVISVALKGPDDPPPRLAHPCGGCAGGCLPAFQRALATVVGAATADNLRANWRAWLACRDACPTGREHRYDEAQIRYHYLGQHVSFATDQGEHGGLDEEKR